MLANSKLGVLVLVVVVGASVLGGLGCGDGQNNHVEVALATSPQAAHLPWAVRVVDGSGAGVPGADRAYRSGNDVGSEQWSFTIRPGQRYVLKASCTDSADQSMSASFSGDNNHYFKIAFQQAPSTGRCQVADVTLDGHSQLGADAGAPGSTGPAGYYLPWPAGESLYVVQGNDGSATHCPTCSGGAFRYAWDFSEDINATVEGHRIVAVADGVVSYVGDDTEGWGHYVILEHTEADGTPRYSLYGHLQQVDPKVKVGQPIRRGCPVGILGKTGKMSNGYAHLHFQFMDALFLGGVTAPSVPGSFNEGVPQQGSWPQSQNQPSQPCD